MSLAHNGNSQLSDSNTGEEQGFSYNNGLSPLGREVIKEMNKYGMMVDFSHPSKGAMMEMLALSKAPIIGSHSGVRAICNHSRNADDEQLEALAKNGGVIQIVAFASYVKCDPKRDSARTAETAALNREFGIVLPQGGRGGAGRGGAALAADAAAAVVVPTLHSTRSSRLSPKLVAPNISDGSRRSRRSIHRRRARRCRTSSTTSTMW